MPDYICAAVRESLKPVFLKPHGTLGFARLFPSALLQNTQENYAAVCRRNFPTEFFTGGWNHHNVIVRTSAKTRVLLRKCSFAPAPVGAPLRRVTYASGSLRGGVSIARIDRAPIDCAADGRRVRRRPPTRAAPRMLRGRQCVRYVQCYRFSGAVTRVSPPPPPPPSRVSDASTSRTSFRSRAFRFLPNLKTARGPRYGVSTRYTRHRRPRTARPHHGRHPADGLTSK